MTRRWPAVLLLLLAALAVFLLVVTGTHETTHDVDGPDGGAGDGGVSPELAGPQLRGGGRPESADATAQSGSPSPPPSPAPHVTGRVVDATGKPVGRALVWWDARTPDAHAVRADSQGRFALPIQDRGGETSTLKARGPGTATASEGVALPNPPDEVDVGDVVLPEGLKIHGRVVDRTGQPRPYVRVRAWSEVEGATGETYAGGTRILFGGDDVATGATGTFALGGLAPEPHRVYVDLTFSGGWKAEPPEFTGVVPGGEPLTFVLVGRTRVSGTVVDATSGAPVTRFQVRGRPVNHPDGRFEATLAAGQPLEVRARGYMSYSRHDLALREGEAAGGLTVRLEPNPNTCTLVVCAVDGAGSPVTGWRVEGIGPDWFGWSEHCGDPSSEVRITGLVPGRHVFTVRGTGLSHARGTVEIPRLTEVERKVVLERGGTLRLRALAPDGRPLKHASLEVLDESGKPRYWHFVYTRPQGMAIVVKETSGVAGKPSELDGRVSGLPAGRYTVRITQGDTRLEQVVDLPPEGEITLDLRRRD